MTADLANGPIPDHEAHQLAERYGRRLVAIVATEAASDLFRTTAVAGVPDAEPSVEAIKLACGAIFDDPAESPCSWRTFFDRLDGLARERDEARAERDEARARVRRLEAGHDPATDAEYEALVYEAVGRFASGASAGPLDRGILIEALYLLTECTPAEAGPLLDALAVAGPDVARFGAAARAALAALRAGAAPESSGPTGPGPLSIHPPLEEPERID